MLEFILEILRDFFQLQLDVWQRIQVSENVSMWDIIIVVFVLSGLGYAIINAFGGLSGQSLNTVHDVQEYNNRQKYQSNSNKFKNINHKNGKSGGN